MKQKKDQPQRNLRLIFSLESCGQNLRQSRGHITGLASFGSFLHR